MFKAEGANKLYENQIGYFLFFLIHRIYKQVFNRNVRTIEHVTCFYGAKFPLDLNDANVAVVFSRSFCSF